MGAQQLFFAADDQHRAVLLAGCMEDMGQPVALVAAAETVRASALVLWTQRAARTPWLAGVFEQHPDAIALVLDQAPLPPACQRVVHLSTWPARSADASIGALVRWLKDSSAPVPFARVDRGGRREPGSGSALAILGIVAVLLGALLLSERVSEPDDAPTDLPTPRAASQAALERQSGASRDARAGAELSIAVAAGGPPAAASSVAEGEPSQAAASADAVAEAGTLRARGAGEDPAPEPGSQSDVGRSALRAAPARLELRASDSLAHLCRARSLAAARAWYGVLTARQKRLAATLPCVRALLERPGFAALREEIQA